MKIKVVFAGDTHGSLISVKNKVDAAVRHGSQRVLVLGDFGLWWGFEGVKFLDAVNDYARANNVQVFAIPGNHECHELWDHLVEGAREAGATAHGWAYVRTHVLLSPKVHAFKWGNKNFVVAGGAVSIDKEYRLDYERDKGKKIWSPNEQLTDDDVKSVAELIGRGSMSIDYLLTHDCSDATPWKYRLKPDLDSQIHRQRIDRVLKMVRPKVHFHGHMHERYEWDNLTGPNYGDVTHWTKTFGLECNDDADSWGILDLETDTFTFASDL